MPLQGVVSDGEPCDWPRQRLDLARHTCHISLCPHQTSTASPRFCPSESTRHYDYYDNARGLVALLAVAAMGRACWEAEAGL